MTMTICSTIIAVNVRQQYCDEIEEEKIDSKHSGECFITYKEIVI